MKVKEFQHPLEAFVLSLFTPRHGHDETSLAWALGAPTRPMKGVAAYRVVAGDVLAVLKQRGLLETDKEGWYYLPVAAASACPPPSAQ